MRRNRNNKNKRYYNRNGAGLVPTDRDYIQWNSTSSGTGSFTFPDRYNGRQIKIISLELQLLAQGNPALCEVTFFGSAEPFSTRELVISPSIVMRKTLRPRRAADFIDIPATGTTTAFVLTLTDKCVVNAVANVILRPKRNDPNDLVTTFVVPVK